MKYFGINVQCTFPELNHCSCNSLNCIAVIFLEDLELYHVNKGDENPNDLSDLTPNQLVLLIYDATLREEVVHQLYKVHDTFKKYYYTISFIKVLIFTITPQILFKLSLNDPLHSSLIKEKKNPNDLGALTPNQLVLLIHDASLREEVVHQLYKIYTILFRKNNVMNVFLFQDHTKFYFKVSSPPQKNSTDLGAHTPNQLVQLIHDASLCEEVVHQLYKCFFTSFNCIVIFLEDLEFYHVNKGNTISITTFIYLLLQFLLKTFQWRIYQSHHFLNQHWDHRHHRLHKKGHVSPLQVLIFVYMFVIYCCLVLDSRSMSEIERRKSSLIIDFFCDVLLMDIRFHNE
ncbi:hypothetical protein H5410_037999 [Solanum commersonii]|uniref:Uncharacterized protein n=1 Tax=Solanum commersonii TaxID=4109 RepID=A0A9J5YA19_SOLCO|nr:hypothetical protein H5410_037999 [Solanum commersonii]